MECGLTWMNEYGMSDDSSSPQTLMVQWLSLWVDGSLVNRRRLRTLNGGMSSPSLYRHSHIVQPENYA